MNPIIIIIFIKNPMLWELINLYLLHPSDSVIKSMFHNQNLSGLPKYWPKKLNKAPCTIFYTEKMTTLPKGTTPDTTNIWPGEFIHMEFAFNNVTSIRGFTYMLTVLCVNTRILWVFPTAYKWSPALVIRFILTNLKN